MTAWGRLFLDESAASLAEYAIVATLVSIACIVILATIGGQVSTFFSTVAGDF